MNPTPNYFLGIPRTVIPGLSTYKIIAQPQVDFQPHYLVIPRSIAPYFFITNIMFGKESQLISPDPLAAETFSGEVIILKDKIVGTVSDLPLSMLMSECRVGLCVCVTVQNHDITSKWFSGVIVGPPLATGKLP